MKRLDWLCMCKDICIRIKRCLVGRIDSMTAFVPVDSAEIIKAYRPNVSALDNPRAWWRYSILAESYKLRCQQREEKWRIAGNKNLNILAHIRLLISANNNSLDIDFSEVNEDFMTTTASRVVALETTVDQLNRDNMMLRKMLKALLTPIAKENLANNAESLSYIEEQITQFDNYTAAMETLEPSSPQNLTQSKIIYESNESIESEQIENQLQDEMISTLVNSIETPDINLRSPYENILPPIEMTEKDFQELPQAGKVFGKKSKSPLKTQTLNNSTSPSYKTEKNPNYLEKEIIRKETKKKKKEQMIMMKAELLLREAAVDNEIKPTMYLPVFKNKPDKCIEPNSARSRESVNNNNLSVQTSDNTAGTGNNNRISSKKPNKQFQSKQPEWNDNYRAIDSMKGHGKGRPKEENIPKNDNKIHDINKKNDNKIHDINKKSDNKTHDMNKKSDNKTHNNNGSPMNKDISSNNINNTDKNKNISTTGIINQQNNPQNIFAEKERIIPESEKVTRDLINKARNQLLKPSEVQKPLTSMELKLLNSPLALPVIKQPSVTAMSVTSPRSNKNQLSSSTISLSPRSNKELNNRTHSFNKNVGIKPTQVSPRNKGFIHVSQKDINKRENNHESNSDVSSQCASESAASPHTATIDSNTHLIPSCDKIMNNSRTAIISSSSENNNSSVSEKERKRVVLKSLNARSSNPNSPRKEGSAATTDGGDNTTASTTGNTTTTDDRNNTTASITRIDEDMNKVQTLVHSAINIDAILTTALTKLAEK